jgi:glutathione S-transferase
MADYQLHCFAQSGNAYKVALMLALTKSSWEPVFVDFFNGETRGARFRTDLNEMGEVPVLAFDGKQVTQSGAILTLLSERTGKFGSNDAEARYEVLRWILFDNHKFTSYLATFRFFHAFAKPLDPAVMDFLRARVRAGLGIVEKHLATRTFVVGDAATIADLSLCGYLYYPADEFGFDIAQESPAIAAWLARIKALPGWVHPYDLMPGHPLPKRGA